MPYTHAIFYGLIIKAIPQLHGVALNNTLMGKASFLFLHGYISLLALARPYSSGAGQHTAPENSHSGFFATYLEFP